MQREGKGRQSWGSGLGSHFKGAEYESKINPLDSKGNYSATSNNTKLVH